MNRVAGFQQMVHRERGSVSRLHAMRIPFGIRYMRAVSTYEWMKRVPEFTQADRDSVYSAHFGVGEVSERGSRT